MFDYLGKKLLGLINCVFFKGYSLVLSRPNHLGLYNWLNLRLRGAKEIDNLSHLICQLLITMIHILNQQVKYNTYLLGKQVNHIMVTFIYLLYHRHHGICSESRHRLGTKSHPQLGLHGLTRVTYSRS